MDYIQILGYSIYVNFQRRKLTRWAWRWVWRWVWLWIRVASSLITSAFSPWVIPVGVHWPWPTTTCAVGKLSTLLICKVVARITPIHIAFDIFASASRVWWVPIFTFRPWPVTWTTIMHLAILISATTTSISKCVLCWCQLTHQRSTGCLKCCSLHAI